MRYLFLLLLVGCYTAKKAEKDINKIQEKHPEVLAKKAASLYPIKNHIDSSEFVNYLEQINMKIDSILVKDTIIDTIKFNPDCIKIKKELRNSYKFIKGLQETMNNIPQIIEYKEDSAKIYLCQSEYNKLSKDRDKYRSKCELFKTLMIWILIFLILSLIGHIIKR